MTDAEKIAKMKSWVRHWMEDVNAGLSPTKESLQRAMEELNEGRPPIDPERERKNFRQFMAIGDNDELLD